MSIPSVPSFSSFDIGPNSGTEETIIVDELKFSNIVRYNTGFIPINDVGMDENTIGYWQFNEGSLDANVPAAYDWSGNGLHMEIMGVDLSLSGYVGDAPQRTDAENALVINEIMQNPTFVSDILGEWIEITNISDIILLISIILGNDIPNAHAYCAGDLNNDIGFNILDISLYIHLLLN